MCASFYTVISKTIDIKKERKKKTVKKNEGFDSVDEIIIAEKIKKKQRNKKKMIKINFKTKPNYI